MTNLQNYEHWIEDFICLALTNFLVTTAVIEMNISFVAYMYIIFIAYVR